MNKEIKFNPNKINYKIKKVNVFLEIEEVTFTLYSTPSCFETFTVDNSKDLVTDLRKIDLKTGQDSFLYSDSLKDNKKHESYFDRKEPELTEFTTQKVFGGLFSGGKYTIFFPAGVMKIVIQSKKLTGKKVKYVKRVLVKIGAKQ